MFREYLGRTSVLILLTMSVTPVLFKTAYGQHESADRDARADVPGVLPISTAVSASMKGKFIKEPQTSVLWDGRQYDVNSGVAVLMAVITDRRTDVATRAEAINKLGHFSTSLQNRACLDTLVALYEELQSRMEKRQLLRCLIAAEDPRGLNLLYRVATTESDPVLRLAGASGLAVWNIREGIHQLIELFTSRVETGLREVGAAALLEFAGLNERKGWNCPEENIRERALAAVGLEREQYTEETYEEYAKALIQGYREWFANGKHRFPEWRPGDPLPEIPALEATDPDPD